jgi:hypothetical protein
MPRRPIFALALVAAVGGAACEEKKTEPTPAAAPAAAPVPAPSGAPVAPSGAAAAPAAAPSGDKGTVKGTVVLTGKPPEMAEQKRQTDAFCAKTPQKDDEVVVGKGGALGNVLVRINGLPATPAPAKPAELNQDKCSYSPRVQGIVAGQTLQIKNSDPVLHNVREIKGAMTKKNFAQVPGTPPVGEQDLKEPGTMMKFKCDIHQWMTAYVWVQNNDAFAVSDKDGKFEIDNVPVGTWDVTAWHERFGEKNAKITVSKDKPAEIKLEFAAK